jgi:hypothetical protein
MMSLVSRNIVIARKPRRRRLVVVVKRLSAARMAKIGLALVLGIVIAATIAKTLHWLAARPAT